jgi:hypothetical protein
LIDARGTREWLHPAELQRWLLDAGLATNGNGVLTPTQLGLEEQRELREAWEEQQRERRDDEP